MSGVVGVVLKGYPRLSETFIAQEILALERAGVPLRLYSLRHPTDDRAHPIHAEIVAPVTYLPEYLHDEPLRVAHGWRQARRRPGYRLAFSAWLRDLVRDPTINRVRRFGQALVLAGELPDDVDRLYAHFLHTPASVTRYAAIIRGLDFSVSAHAKDIWTTPEWEKREKLADCRWLVTCTRANAEHLSRLAPDRERVALLYHGLDLDRFSPCERDRPAPDGTDAGMPVMLLSVGRLVEKKGYDVLINALARLPSALHWHFVHVGGGPLLAKLKSQAHRAGLDGRITWRGAEPHDAVVSAYRRADLFVLACRVAADGDRDGLPNVLMEAQSQGLACVSTAVSAIPELILDGETGVLVEPEDPVALALALEKLIRSPLLRARLGAAGLGRVHNEFAFDRTIPTLIARFRRELAMADPCASLSTPR